MNNICEPKLQVGDIVEIPDGFDKDGNPRPWTRTKIEDIGANWVKVYGVAHPIPYYTARKV